MKMIIYDFHTELRHKNVSFLISLPPLCLHSAVLIGPEGSALLIPKHTTGHNPRPFQCSSHSHTLFP